jgi:hypothetical protein
MAYNMLSPVHNYVYIVIRLKISKESNGLDGRSLFFHYVEINDVVLIIGGLVQTSETLMANAIRYCRHLVDFRFAQNNRLYLSKVLNEFKNHEHVKMYIKNWYSS